MAFFNFRKNFRKLTRRFRKKGKKEEEKKRVLTLSEMMQELGISREGIIGTYETEENPDDYGPSTYIQMQENDGEVQAIVRILTLPIVSADIHILPAKGDKGERDFIETVFTAPPYLGGMTTPLPFLVADMTRAIFEGFRLYEKVARVIDKGKYKGLIGWKKLAPRDARTITLRADEHGGFAGAYQRATFGEKTVSVALPPEKCLLFTFQKEKHWLYGESILKTAVYHYDKKHKLYYIAHKKAEIESLGLKVLKISQALTEEQRKKAEEVVDTIGINSRISLPPGVELEIIRGGQGYDPLPLIEHHNAQMAKAALAQVLEQAKYAYPYGKKPTPSQFLVLAIKSIMRQMEHTLNTYAVAPLIDYNFGTQAYPKIRFAEISDITQYFLERVFTQIMKQDKLPEGFINEVVDKTAEALKLDWRRPKEIMSKEALKAFEKGKIEMANKLKIPAPRTLPKIKDKILKTKVSEAFLKKCFELGKEYSLIYAKEIGKKNLPSVRNQE